VSFEYHVSPVGSDAADGSASAPFATISRAARLARGGDTVVVHGGVYREQVNPLYGGVSDLERVTYRAAEGERPVISGAEVVSDWEPVGGGVWRTVVDNSVFGGFNPFERELFGDWLQRPDVHKNEAPKHLGDVYLDGRSLYESTTLSGLTHPVARTEDIDDAIHVPCPIEDPEWTKRLWYAEVNETATQIWANFGDADPREHAAEISVRECCFFPQTCHVDYITVEGFEMRQAATPWAPPTAEQRGIIGPNWSTGWIIRDNSIHDSKCTGICLGMPTALGDNDWFRTDRKTGYQYQLEAVFKGLRHGWEKGVVGSHVVADNEVYNCGQSAINGHMGCAFSTIEHNHVHHIGLKREFFGWEVAGIKFHAAIDTQIMHNYVHDCSLAVWLDWQAQGTRLGGNVFTSNVRDLMVEVSHGPYIVDNNVFASDFSFQNFAQGGAFVNNLICGRLDLLTVLDRSTPYHFPHTTDVAGCAFVSGGDDRWVNNIFVKPSAVDDPHAKSGMSVYDDYPRSMVEYKESIYNQIAKGLQGGGDPRPVQAVYTQGNVYAEGVEQMKGEDALTGVRGLNASISQEDDGSAVLDITVPKEVATNRVTLASTSTLGNTRIVEQLYENPDGTAITFDEDIRWKKRAKKSVSGPLAQLSEGNHHITVWRPSAKVSRAK
jgi:hypothetical protein